MDWAAAWAPYHPEIYQEALSFLRPGQRIVDIGAGDLRFARQAAELGCTVFAVENQPHILARGPRIPTPPALHPVLADARTWPFPADLDAAVLLMRHCPTDHYALYVRKLRAVGCPTLITNARWRTSVEQIPIFVGVPFCSVMIGWAACVLCGRITFVEGDVDLIDEALLQTTTQVEGCPHCTPTHPYPTPH